MEAVANCQSPAGLLARGDHRVAISSRSGHRLLADDVLAGAKGRDDVLGVDAGRRHHIDDIDRLISGDLVPLLVRIDIGFIEAVELRELHALLARTRDHRHELHVLRLQQRRRQFTVRVVTQAAQRETERLAAGFRRAECGGEGITSGQAAKGTEEGTTSRAHRGRSFLPLPSLPASAR